LKPVSVYPSGDQAMTISFGSTLSVEANERVIQLYHHLTEQRKKFWIDIIPAYSSITIIYDLVSIRRYHSPAYEWIKKELMEVLEELQAAVNITRRTIQVPVCYDLRFGSDIKRICAAKKITKEELIALHTARSYRVFMIGFLPGFAYMGSVEDKIAMPRLAKPRTQVAAGSVGIAGNQTGIYPLDSPGGWNIIGRTPLQLFHPNQSSLTLLQPGDEVKFVSITMDEFKTLQPSNEP
jgi:inhibitor of KinA